LLVVGIEELFKAWVKRPITEPIRKNKCFKKPGSVRQVPLGGTAIRHGLQHLIFSGKRAGHIERGPAYISIFLE
jgi:hypothetical protein